MSVLWRDLGSPKSPGERSVLGGGGLVLVRVLYESGDEVLGVLLHIALEVADRIVNGHERLSTIHCVANTARVIGVDASADIQTISVPIEHELHGGVGAVAEGDVTALGQADIHFGGEVGDDIPNLHLCEIAFHIRSF